MNGLRTTISTTLLNSAKVSYFVAMICSCMTPKLFQLRFGKFAFVIYRELNLEDFSRSINICVRPKSFRTTKFAKFEC